MKALAEVLEGSSGGEKGDRSQSMRTLGLRIGVSLKLCSPDNCFFFLACRLVWTWGSPLAYRAPHMRTLWGYFEGWEILSEGELRADELLVCPCFVLGRADLCSNLSNLNLISKPYIPNKLILKMNTHIQNYKHAQILFAPCIPVLTALN